MQSAGQYGSMASMAIKFTKKALSQIGSILLFVLAWLVVLQKQPARLPSATPSPSPTAPAATVSGDTTTLYPVVQIVDGDTIKVEVDGVRDTVRLVGINTPESVDPRRPVECLSREATVFLQSLLMNNLVSLETDAAQSNRDRYGRLLRFVFLPDGTDAGLKMIQEGYAHEALYSSKPHKYRQAYVDAQNAAIAAQRGLWNPDLCPVTLEE